jgi:hypothetical protein
MTMIFYAPEPTRTAVALSRSHSINFNPIVSSFLLSQSARVGQTVRSKPLNPRSSLTLVALELLLIFVVVILVAIGTILLGIAILFDDNNTRISLIMLEFGSYIIGLILFTIGCLILANSLEARGSNFLSHLAAGLPALTLAGLLIFAIRRF